MHEHGDDEEPHPYAIPRGEYDPRAHLRIPFTDGPNGPEYYQGHDPRARTPTERPVVHKPQGYDGTHW